jgi:hypothetical protein
MSSKVPEGRFRCDGEGSRVMTDALRQVTAMGGRLRGERRRVVGADACQP